jgi:hypothetical protein
MSISVQLQPQQLEPVYNPIIIVATSSRQSEDGFQMIGDVYVRGDNVTRMRVNTNPDGFCLFDIHKHIENKISFDFNPNSSGWTIATYSAATYSVRLGEEWRPKWTFFDNFFLTGSKLGFIGLADDNPQPQFGIGDTINVVQTSPFTFSQYNGVATITGIFATSGLAAPYNGNRWIIETNKNFLGNTPVNGGTISLFGFRTYINENEFDIGWTTSIADAKWAFNGVTSFLDEISWTSSNWTIGVGTASFLTNVPQHYEVGTFSRMWLSVFQGAGDVDKLTIIADGKTFSITNSFTNPQTSNNQPFIQIGCGPFQLINATSSITSVGGSSFPVISNTTKEYTIWGEDTTSGEITKRMTFKLKNYCSRYEKIQLVFLDKLGSFIPFTFNFANRLNKTISKTNYSQVYGSYAPSIDNWTYRTWDRGTKSLDTIVTDSYGITSDWINQTTSDFLMTLMESPEVYWINELGVTLAVTLTVTNVERKQIINDQIINYTITMELSNKNNTQRG